MSAADLAAYAAAAVIVALFALARWAWDRRSGR